jgi:PAS domain S-box-containing protein
MTPPELRTHEEERYRTLVDVLSEGIVMQLADGTIETVNDSACRMLGVKARDVVGKRLLDLRWHAIRESGERLPHEDHPALVTLRTGDAQHGVVLGVYKPDRSLVWVSVNAEPLFRGEAGTPYAVVSSFTDITRAKMGEQALRESEGRYRRLSEATLDGIAITENGVIRDVNRAFREMFGYSDEELLGHSALEVVAPEERQRARTRLEKAIEGTYLSFGLHKNGSRIPVQVRAYMTLIGGKTTRVTILRDLRERDSASRLQSELISTVSHELRTPLTSIRGALGLMEGGTAGELPTRATDLVRVARANCDRLIKLVNDLLDLDRIATGKLQLIYEPLDLPAIVESVFAEFRGAAGARGIELVAEVPPDVHLSADRVGVRRVVTSLVENAIKFSLDGSRVIVRARNISSRVHIEVEDRGIGLSSELIERIFRPFTAGDQSDRRPTGGAGLGLAIVRSIVDMHDGRIDVRSTPGQETVFCVDLPYRRLGSTPEGASAAVS